MPGPQRRRRVCKRGARALFPQASSQGVLHSESSPLELGLLAREASHVASALASLGDDCGAAQLQMQVGLRRPHGNTPARGFWRRASAKLVVTRSSPPAQGLASVGSALAAAGCPAPLEASELALSGAAAAAAEVAASPLCPEAAFPATTGAGDTRIVAAASAAGAPDATPRRAVPVAEPSMSPLHRVAANISAALWAALRSALRLPVHAN
jgi:hypothetical protein